MKKFLLYVAIILLLTAGMAAAADVSWLEIGADYRFRYDILEGKVHDYISQAPGNPPISSFKVWNNSLWMDRLGINLRANATEDLTVKARLIMYKAGGHQTMQPVQGNFFADRAPGPFDGIVGHVPSSDTMKVDQAYATWSNIGGAPVWFSAGRRPSTGGVPTNIRQNLEKTGTAGVPGNMIDYAFDGVTAGYSPDIDALPGAYAKLCYGKGFDSGYTTLTNTLKDTDFVGLNVVPYDTNNLHIDLQVQKGFHLADWPADFSPPPNNNQQPIDPNNPPISPQANVGDISWWGGVVMGKVNDLNLFAAVAQSKTDPNGNISPITGDSLLGPAGSTESHTGTSIYVGGRYDMSTGTKIGAEFNQGSKYWIGMIPAADDIWTSKLGTRGKVYEVYVIQELNKKPLMKRAKAFCRVGYQYYKFDYTGSNNWMGAPVKISDLDLTNLTNAQFLAPLQDAKDLYITLEVLF